MKKLLFIAIGLLMTGCATVSTAQRPNDYYTQGQSDEKKEALFGNSGEKISDKDIERILNYQLKLPRKNRIAILKLSKDIHWRFYSNDFHQLDESIAEDFIGSLRSSPRVYDASFLPSMLVPDQRTVPYLREAAARYQADLLLAYRSKCQTFEKYKFIDPNETRAYCTVETVLLDVRSGIVPFTTVSSNEFVAKKDKGDMNFRETIRKAEMKTIAKSLKEAASEIKTFLDGVGDL